jgi:NNP family nitrate/nitrite transporter-like MFS transporter
MSKYMINTWEPETSGFWQQTGKSIANRNLWISIPALLLAFAVWMVWSVVVVNLPSIGFKYSTNQLFWLTALPGLSGATLRIFYSFMVPIFGGRKWTTISTASLLIPAIGIGFAVQDINTGYPTMLVLALLCGFGGGNFASSMANISFFYPKAQKGFALGMNAGLGNLGVSAVQFVVPLVITVGVFGAIGGEPQSWMKAGVAKQLWLQNAGFIWVPFIAATALIAWFGMNDLATAKASFSEQAVIFKRKHNWLMCWLYTGTFGSFIGYSAAFPLLIKTAFPDVNPLQYAFLGPLVGALARVARRHHRRQAGRRPCHLVDFLPDDRCGAGCDSLHAARRRRRQFLGLLQHVHVAVCLHRRGQRFDLPHDPGDLSHRTSA